MDGSTKEGENVKEINFVSFFDMDSERYTEPGYPERYSIQNLRKIEQNQQEQLKVLAERMGGKYIPPTDSEVTDKFNHTLEANPFVFPTIGSGNRIWALHEKSLYSNMPNCASFNNSGEHGIIIFPEQTQAREEAEPRIRLYRGATIEIGQLQTAPLARLDGVDTKDLLDYRDGKTNLEQILEKVTDVEEKRYLVHTLDGIRKAMTNGNTTEIEELRRLHTCFTPGALDWDLWVSAAYKPENTYRDGAKSVGNVYGDFFNLEEGYLEGILILDVPESEVVKYNGEAGIFGQVKPEWIRAIVPQQTAALEKNIQHAEALILNNL